MIESETTVRRRRMTLGAWLITAALGAGACSKPSEKVDAPRPARVMSVQRAAADDVKIYAGEVRPRYEVDLAFRIGGKLLERRADVGAAVTKGQALARLDPQDARLSAAAAAAQVAAADADLAFAKSELDRSKQLLDQKFISQAAYDNKLSSHNVAAAKRESARAQSAVSGNQAAYTTLISDSSGIITAVLAEAGQGVAAGQAVMKLAKTEEREVVISVAESQATTIKAGGRFGDVRDAVGQGVPARVERLRFGRKREANGDPRRRPRRSSR